MLKRAYPLLVTGIAAPLLLAATRRSTAPPHIPTTIATPESSALSAGMVILLLLISAAVLVYAFYQINKWSVLRSADFESSMRCDLANANEKCQMLEDQVTKLQNICQRHAPNIQTLIAEITKLKEHITTLDDAKPPTSTKILARIIDGG